MLYYVCTHTGTKYNKGVSLSFRPLSRQNAAAPENMPSMSMTWSTVHPTGGWLNAAAKLQIYRCSFVGWFQLGPRTSTLIDVVIARVLVTVATLPLIIMTSIDIDRPFSSPPCPLPWLFLVSGSLCLLTSGRQLTPSLLRLLCRRSGRAR